MRKRKKTLGVQVIPSRSWATKETGERGGEKVEQSGQEQDIWSQSASACEPSATTYWLCQLGKSLALSVPASPPTK